MTTTPYAQRFAGHIDGYIDATLGAKEVRQREFEALYAFAGLDEPSSILEFPTEGAVADYYPRARIEYADQVRVGAAQLAARVQITDYAFSGIEGGFDAVLSVVPIHHADAIQKACYLHAARRVLNPGGTLAFAEVGAGTTVHRFLDEFVDAHTAGGHRGEYPEPGFTRQMEQAGFARVVTGRTRFPWVFNSGRELARFCTRAFVLDAMTEHELLAAVDRYLGLREVGGKLHMNWELLLFKGVRS